MTQGLPWWTSHHGTHTHTHTRTRTRTRTQSKENDNSGHKTQTIILQNS